ncbi:MAG TPA: stage II sporulation protein M [Candidatus Binatia bacterium]|nr:stage II sporulation protein M [Candidatus Binatia bacterium]
MLILSRQERRVYLRRLLPYITGSLVLFALGILIGLIVVQRVPGARDNFADTLADFTRMFTKMPPWKLAGAIFLNNSLKTLAAVVLGAVLGIVPGIFLLANGAALAVAVTWSIQTRGLSHSLMSILPHGILELPAVFLATSVGLLLGIHVLKRLRGQTAAPIKDELVCGLKFYFTLVLPVLLIAALVEAFITAALVMPRS